MVREQLDGETCPFSAEPSTLWPRLIGPSGNHPMSELRIAVRTLLRNPGFLATAVLSLALAIGASKL
jgi:hypothetical protein